ncbi:MAG: 2-succinyl-5-enolpyruvyl-6-hydroxy-3-cyclohexene-1-carboxylic-acid synthase, partial [Paramuribaculum sp.]|nr:2-succinyl-5-enolpyruvyl-6-hydroxy-3-cyclohexene-1-carboxylic-acid synthase [Paramuribaculum sp.]
MITTSNITARRLAELLAAHDISRVVVSPGSRNAPVLQAVASNPSLKSQLVTDERQAGFLALGMARASGEPVALVCTSGSAALEYMPAVSEAFYSRTPLIVITADRPAQWIGQDDSQTIVQPGVMSTIVKKSYNLPPVRSDEDEWFVCRQVNDAILTATSGAPGPVHINIIIDVPIGALTEIPDDNQRPAPLRMVTPMPWLAPEHIKELAMKVASTPRVMLVCGFMAPDRKLNESIGRLSRLPNVAVLTETIANLHGPLLIPNIDGTLAAVRGAGADDFEPQLVITVGGALV